MNPFSLLIKPAGADCNLQCGYCFYLDRKNLYPSEKKHRMSDETLEKLISGYMATNQPQYCFNWQGGEPLLMGPGFFSKAVEFQKKYGRGGAIVVNTLQTNNTMMSPELAGFLAKYKFLTGVSLDGPPEIHDRHRVCPDSRGSHAAVLRGIKCLKGKKAAFNILTLVSEANVNRAKEVYGYIRGLGYKYHQYIPCVEFDHSGRPESFAITGARWGEFLCGIYDEWVKNDVNSVSVRLFDAILSVLVKNEYTVCQMKGDCCQYFVVEYNGDVYPCDFFVEQERKIGNITRDSWEKMQGASAYLDFGKQKGDCSEKCAGCAFFRFCRGDCLKYRVYGGNSAKNISWLCEGWKMFYRHSLPGLEKIASKL